MTFPGVITACLILTMLSAAAAQTWRLRVAFNTNLRASHSLQSRIVETAPASTTLSVVGSVDRWLKINRPGRDLWMANWVSYTRVEVGSAAGEVDNCCFIGWQCHSNEYWERGFWAHQNNQCGGTPNASAPA